MKLVILADVDEMRPACPWGVPPHVSLVFWSSRTFEAVRSFQRLGGRLDEPFFVENGSALFLPKRTFPRVPFISRDVGEFHLIEFGCCRRQAADVVDRLARSHALAIRRTSDSGSADRREYDDAFELDPRHLAPVAIHRTLARAGLRWTRSAALNHVNGVLDPGVGLSVLRGLYEAKYGHDLITAGLGGTLNHMPLLAEVDLPFLVDDAEPVVVRRVRRAAKRVVPQSGLAALPGLFALQGTPRFRRAAS